jgi:hypothetical protein
MLANFQYTQGIENRPNIKHFNLPVTKCPELIIYKTSHDFHNFKGFREIICNANIMLHPVVKKTK